MASEGLGNENEQEGGRVLHRGTPPTPRAKCTGTVFDVFLDVENVPVHF